MNVELKKIRKNVIIVGAIIIVAGGALFWYFLHSFVTIAVTPREASLFLDDKKIKIIGGEAGISTSIGEHTVRVSANDYIGRDETIKLKRGLNKKIQIDLTATPEPVEINSNAEFLMKGSDFSDGYYLSDRTIYKAKVGIDQNGDISVVENKAITDSKLADIKEIIWSPSRDLALFRKSGGVTLFDFMKYDFINQTETAWGSSDIGSIAWSPDNSKIAYYYAPNTGEKSLIFANIANTEPERVANFAELGIVNPILRWSPDSQWLLVIPRNIDFAKNKIYLFNAYSRTIKELADSGSNLDAIFSPDGKYILYSSYSKIAGTPVTSRLLIMDKDGNNKRDLDLRADLSKVAWSKDSKSIVIATLDPDTSKESVFSFNTETKERSGFSINDLGDTYIDAIAYSDDGRALLYEAGGKIYALKVN